MAWNGSGNGGGPSSIDRGTAPIKHPKKARWTAFSLVAFTFVACISVYLMTNQNKQTNGDNLTKKSPNRIAKASPAKTPANAVVSKVAETNTIPLGPQKVGEVRNGMVLLPNGTLHRRKGLRKIECTVDRKHPSAIFDTPTDNEIAAVLTLSPGEQLIGGPLRHGGQYKERFLKSLQTPIIVKTDDPEDIKELKRAVIQVRKDMKDAIDRGEDPKQIINDAYVEAQKLALYKDTLKQEVLKAKRNGQMSDEEFGDYVAAANKMLKKKGIASMKFGCITRARIQKMKK